MLLQKMRIPFSVPREEERNGIPHIGVRPVVQVGSWHGGQAWTPGHTNLGSCPAHSLHGRASQSLEMYKMEMIMFNS